MKGLKLVKFIYLPALVMASLLIVSGCTNDQQTQQSPQPNSQPQPQKIKEANQTSSQQPAAKVSPDNLLQDTLIIPGDRVGPITAKTTKQDLVKLFDESRVTDKTIDGPEGIGKFAATQVNLGEDKSFLVVWTDDTRTKIADVRNLGTAWKTPEGIGVGTSFQELRQKLGEFKLTGLGWDYGGFVNLDGTKLSQYQGKLILRVDADYKVAQNFPTAMQAVSGDQQLSSTNPNWKDLRVKVSQINVVFNRLNQ